MPRQASGKYCGGLLPGSVPVIVPRGRACGSAARADVQIHQGARRRSRRSSGSSLSSRSVIRLLNSSRSSAGGCALATLAENLCEPLVRFRGCCRLREPDRDGLRPGEHVQRLPEAHRAASLAARRRLISSRISSVTWRMCSRFLRGSFSITKRKSMRRLRSHASCMARGSMGRVEE